MKSFQMGIQFLAESGSNLGDIIDDVLAAKATSTIHARADAMFRYVAWYKKDFADEPLFPFQEARVYFFITEIGKKSAPTFPRGFCCALAFVGHVMGCPSALECLDSRRILGHASKCFKEKRMLVQKPPISSEHVRILEYAVLGKFRLKVQDRAAAGFFLFMIYARARFSDAQAASSLVADVCRVGWTSSSGPSWVTIPSAVVQNWFMGEIIRQHR